MGLYDLQEYLNFLSQHLDSDNKNRALATDRATRIQDEFMYRKEARARKSLHTPPKERAPRMDKRKHNFSKTKPYPEYKLKENKKKYEDSKTEGDFEKLFQGLKKLVDKFSIPSPKAIDVENLFQKKSWFDAVEKVASAGELVLENGVPNYRVIVATYLDSVDKQHQDLFYVKTARIKRSKK